MDGDTTFGSYRSYSSSMEITGISVSVVSVVELNRRFYPLKHSSGHDVHCAKLGCSMLLLLLVKFVIKWTSSWGGDWGMPKS